MLITLYQVNDDAYMNARLAERNPAAAVATVEINRLIVDLKFGSRSKAPQVFVDGVCRVWRERPETWVRCASFDLEIVPIELTFDVLWRETQHGVHDDEPWERTVPGIVEFFPGPKKSTSVGDVFVVRETRDAEPVFLIVDCVGFAEFKP